MSVKDYKAVMTSNDKAAVTQIKAYVRGVGDDGGQSDRDDRSSDRPIANSGHCVRVRNNVDRVDRPTSY
jgi:hypothetical protein